MKKLNLVAILCLLIVGLMVAPAKAEKSGMYLGVKLVDSIQSVWLEDSSESANTIGGALFVGYDFYPKFDLPLRAELEYTLRSDFHSEFSAGNVSADYKFNAQTLLANVYYDFHNSSAFTPYVGAGLGFGFLKESIDVNIGTLGADDSRSATTFAWQLGVGVAYAFNDNLSADLGYRYISYGTSNGDIANSDVSSYASGHEFALGLRFSF